MQKYNIIDASISFLNIFGLKFNQNDEKKLYDILNSEGILKIYDNENNYVGNLSLDKNCYVIRVMLEHHIISSVSYVNYKGVLSYIYRYDIIKDNSDYKVNGYFRINIYKNDKKVENSYKLCKNNNLLLKCTFNDIDDKFCISDVVTKKIINYRTHDFYVDFNRYTYTISKDKEDVVSYFKIGKKSDITLDKIIGYILPDEMSFEDEILELMNEDSNLYIDFVNYIKNESDNFYKGLYANTLSTVFYNEDSKGKHKLFKCKNK